MAQTKSSTKCEINLPLPPAALSPNSRAHFMLKARAISQYRRTASLLALAAVPNRPRWKTAKIRATFSFADPARRRDKDNLAASLKAAWDGFTDAGLLDDDRGLTHLPVEIVQGPRGVKVEVWPQ